MKAIIISSINKNLSSAISLIDAIDDKTYCDASVAPYYSSIGSHIRHVLDFFNCIIGGLDTNNVDLTARKRDETIATDKEAAKAFIYELQETLNSFVGANTDYLLHVTDNLGQGKVTVDYTLESILAHANSHAIHHYAVIGYILSFLGIELKISGFGYNPTSPINKKREGI
ncbi:DinB family protein [Aquimarina rhabdastrellae]